MLSEFWHLYSNPRVFVIASGIAVAAISFAYHTMVRGWSTTKSYAGLANYGSSCYLNCLLQAYSSGPTKANSFYIWLSSLVNHADPEDISLRYLFIFKSLLKKLKRKQANPVIHPSELISAFSNGGFHIGVGQQDPLELHTMLCDLLNDFEKAHTGYPQNAGLNHVLPSFSTISKPSSHPFKGKLLSSMVCSRCTHRTKAIVDDFFSLTLYPSQFCNSLHSAMVELLKPEYIPDAKCTSCQQNSCISKVTKILAFPKVFVVHVNRVKWMQGSSVKLQQNLSFPKKIYPQHYIQASFSKDCYQLNAIVTHEGSESNYGHYITYKRVKQASWYYTSDSVVQRVYDTNVMFYIQPYLLFYEKQDDNDTDISMTE